MNGSQLKNLETLIHILGQNIDMKKLNNALPLAVNALNNSEMGYHGKLDIILEVYNTLLL